MGSGARLVLASVIWQPGERNGPARALKVRLPEATLRPRGTWPPFDGVAICPPVDCHVSTLRPFPLPRKMLAEAISAPYERGSQTVAIDRLAADPAPIVQGIAARIAENCRGRSGGGLRTYVGAVSQSTHSAWPAVVSMRWSSRRPISSSGPWNLRWNPTAPPVSSTRIWPSRAMPFVHSRLAALPINSAQVSAWCQSPHPQPVASELPPAFRRPRQDPRHGERLAADVTTLRLDPRGSVPVVLLLGSASRLPPGPARALATGDPRGTHRRNRDRGRRQQHPANPFRSGACPGKK